MKTPLTALALALSILAGSVLASAAEEARDRGVTFQSRVQARYCDKLREGALPYVQFVRRLKPIYGYTYYDFAAEYPGAPVKADCQVGAARVAEVRALLQVAQAEGER